MVLSRVLHLARRITAAGLRRGGDDYRPIAHSVGLTSIGGGYAAMADHTFGAPKNLLLVGIVLALIIILNRRLSPRTWHRLADRRWLPVTLRRRGSRSVCCRLTPPTNSSLIAILRRSMRPGHRAAEACCR